AIASWAFTVNPGQFSVATTWTAFTNRPNNAQYAIYDGNTLLTTVAVNQVNAPGDFTASGASWKYLATSLTVSTSQLRIDLLEAGMRVGKCMIADAVRVEGLPGASGPEIQVLDGSTD